VPGRGGSGPFGESYIGSDSLSRVLAEVREDEGIEAVVMRVNSPGGSGTASDVIWRETCLLRQEKPLVVSMADVAASGGYYIAMSAHSIVAEPTTITGSIGVVTGKFNLRGFWEDWIGIHRDQIKRGENADIFSDYQGFTDPQRQRVRDQMQIFYRDFVTKVASGRGKEYDEIEKLARGRVWSGEQAKSLGLIDELGGLDTAIRIAREKAGIGDGERVAIEVYPRKKGILEALQTQDEARIHSLRLPSSVRRLITALDLHERLARERVLLWAGEM
jgi:protease-4